MSKMVLLALRILSVNLFIAIYPAPCYNDLTVTSYFTTFSTPKSMIFFQNNSLI